MPHLPNLIQDLALILIVGAIVTIIFKIIKQPLVLGYIIAGFLVSPYFHLIPTVADGENIETPLQPLLKLPSLPPQVISWEN